MFRLCVIDSNLLYYVLCVFQLNSLSYGSIIALGARAVHEGDQDSRGGPAEDHAARERAVRHQGE